jgi:hypothetical protein
VNCYFFSETDFHRLSLCRFLWRTTKNERNPLYQCLHMLTAIDGLPELCLVERTL